MKQIAVNDSRHLHVFNSNNSALLSSTFDKNLERRLLMWKEDAQGFHYESKFHYLSNILKVCIIVYSFDYYTSIYILISHIMLN